MFEQGFKGQIGMEIRQFGFCIFLTGQGIIDPKGTETFAKEPVLAKLLGQLKLTAVSYKKKKERGFFSHIYNGKFAVFLVLCCGITCKWVLLFTRYTIYN